MCLFFTIKCYKHYRLRHYCACRSHSLAKDVLIDLQLLILAHFNSIQSYKSKSNSKSSSIFFYSCSKKQTNLICNFIFIHLMTCYNPKSITGSILFCFVLFSLHLLTRVKMLSRICTDCVCFLIKYWIYLHLNWLHLKKEVFFRGFNL